MSTIEGSIDIELPVSTATSRRLQLEAIPDGTEVTSLGLDAHRACVIVQTAVERRSPKGAADNVVGIGGGRITEDIESFDDFSGPQAA